MKFTVTVQCFNSIEKVLEDCVDCNLELDIQVNTNLNKYLQKLSKDYEDINKGIVNSLMYEKQAKHFTKINQLDSAIKYLSIGKLVFL